MLEFQGVNITKLQITKVRTAKGKISKVRITEAIVTKNRIIKDRMPKSYYYKTKTCLSQNLKVWIKKFRITKGRIEFK